MAMTTKKVYQLVDNIVRRTAQLKMLRYLGMSESQSTI